MLKYRTGLKDMPAYDVIEREWNIKVNANECNMNLPPIVADRLMGRLSMVAFNRYPNEEYDALREQIADNHRLQKENILLGNGSSEIIEKLFYAFGGTKTRKIVYPEPSFSMYGIYAKASHGVGIPVAMNEKYQLDLKLFVNTVNENRASLAVICNPNNPTGTAFSLADIEYVAVNINKNCALLIDEAYIEFYGHSAVGLLAKYPNLIIARTFSKAYGLASTRVGYMLASKEIVSMIAKTFMPYHMNVLSLATADVVYQMRHEYVPRIQMMIAERRRMSSLLAKLPGVTVYPSETNFILIQVPDAAKLNEYLVSQGIGVRYFNNAPALKNCLRISMGLREENDSWFNAIKIFLEGRA